MVERQRFRHGLRREVIRVSPRNVSDTESE